MPKQYVLTLTGADRIGIVEEITGILLERGGNVETSRMARLGGEFAVLMLVTMPEDQFTALDDDLDDLLDRGYRIAIIPTGSAHVEAPPGWSRHRIEVRGADHDGIVHRVANHLSRRGISIETLETDTTAGPFGAAPLFNMTALVAVPPDLADGWQDGLAAIGDELNLEIRARPIEGR